jgi:hypothetical protein
LAQTQADLTGHVTGTVQAVGRHDSPVPGAEKAKPAQFPAKYEGHSLVMTIPLSAIGSPPRGARLSYPVAMSGSDLSTEDVAGPQYDYTVGQRCRH